MSDQFDVMPDYLAALELELRARARPVSTAPRRSMPRPRKAWAVVVAVLALVPVLVVADSVRNDERAYGRPAILAARPGPVPRWVRDGFVFTKIAPRGGFTHARRIATFGDTTYLLDGGGTWCLVVPDPATRGSGADSAVSCVPTHEFFRVGIQMFVGGRYVAVIPQGVQPPDVVHPDGSWQRLHPNSLGVVLLRDAASGDQFHLHGLDGQTRTIHAQ